MSHAIPLERVEQRILVLRDHKVMLSTDLAELYGVKSKALVQAVKRNVERFPADFMFQLSWQEVKLIQSLTNSRSQFVTLSWGTNIKHPPYAFTEQGVAMLMKPIASPRRRIGFHPG